MHAETCGAPSMFIAHEPQMPSRQERRKVSVVSSSFLILIKASRICAASNQRSVQQHTTVVAAFVPWARARSGGSRTHHRPAFVKVDLVVLVRRLGARCVGVEPVDGERLHARPERTSSTSRGRTGSGPCSRCVLSLRLARASLGASQLATGTGAGLGKTSWPRASSAGTSAGAGARGRERKGTHAVDMARRAVAAPTAPRSPLAPNIAAVLWFGGVPIVPLCLLGRSGFIRGVLR